MAAGAAWVSASTEAGSAFYSRSNSRQRSNMVLSLKDKETDRLDCEVAALSGETLTDTQFFTATASRGFNCLLGFGGPAKKAALHE